MKTDEYGMIAAYASLPLTTNMLLTDTKERGMIGIGDMTNAYGNSCDIVAHSWAEEVSSYGY